MSASHGLHCSVVLSCLVVLLTLVALLAPRTVCAESLLVLYKEDTTTAIRWHETVRPYAAKQPATVRLNQNGDLMVTYGSVNMVVAYSPPEEPYRQQTAVQLAMVSNQEAPPISGLSIRVNFSF